MTRDVNFSRRAALALIAGTVATASTPILAQTTADSPPATTTPATPPVITEMSLGSADAPVTMIEYASFTCPHCRRFHDEVLPRITKDYIDTGKVRMVYRPIYFYRLGLWADMIARCGGETRYFGISSKIYDQQAEWTQGNSALDIINNLYAIGRDSGLTDTEMQACMQDLDKARALVDESTANADADGINATPTFVINGTVFSNMAYEGFQAAFDKLLTQ